jgi:hypothetical protein
MTRAWVAAIVIFHFAAGNASAGQIEALVSVVRGENIDLPASGDTTEPLDGTKLTLGLRECVVKHGGCTFTGIPPGHHVAGADPADPQLTFLGTSNGPVVGVSNGPGGLVVQPQGVPRLVYKFEKHPKEPSEEDRILADPGQRSTRMKAELWVRIIDDSDGSTHMRPANEHEFAGAKFSLDKAKCLVENEICDFHGVTKGRFDVGAEFVPDPKTILKLAPDNHPWLIVIDHWRHVPVVTGFGTTPVIFIDKIVNLTGGVSAQRPRRK